MKLSARYQRDPLQKRTPEEELDYQACARIFRTLHAHFRGYPWRVEAEVLNGVARIQLDHIMPANTWWTFHIANMTHDMKEVRDAAGALLEHFKLPRRQADIDAYLQIRKSLGLIADPNARFVIA